MSRYELFDRSRIELEPLAARENLVHVAEFPDPADAEDRYGPGELDELAQAIFEARRAGRPVIWMMGAHVIKQGMSRFLIELIEQGWLTLVAGNGACAIHDFELALQGATSEDVAANIPEGRFGMWAETGRLNRIAVEAAERGEGFGEAIGRTIVEAGFQFAQFSIAAAAWRAGVPFTCHVCIGCDIIHQHPNFDAAALARASDVDFLILAKQVERLEGGVFVNCGSAVVGPEVYLKALSMARNVARQRGERIRKFTTAVFDLIPLPERYREGTAPKSEPLYYYRPWKTILVRIVKEGGRSFYFCGDHRVTLPALYLRLVRLSRSAAA